MTKKIAIIGAGPGGYVAAIRAAQLGADVFLIENREVGGTCLNRGCIPTKTYFRNAEIMSSLKRANEFGIEVQGYKLDGKALQDRKKKVVNTLVSGIEKLISSYKNIEFVAGTATLKDKNTISVELLAGGNREVKADDIIIATGSFPQMTETKGVDLEGVITSDELLDLDHIPETLIVVGGGVIGLEFASIYQELGSHVILLASRILKDADKEISRRLTPMLKKQGIETYVDIRAKEITKEGDKLRVVAKYKEKDEEIEVVGDYVLIASGRGPLVNGLNLEGVGVEVGRKGIVVNDDFETTIEGIYAIGDVTGKFQLAHVASKEGCVAVENALGKKSNMNYNVIPQCIYTSPQIASVGMTEAAAVEKGYNIKVGKFPMYANSKASIEGQKEGFAKIICDSKYGEVLGIHLFGENATEIILSGVISLNMEASIEDIANAISPHPSVSETITESAQAAIFKAIHI